MYPLLRHVFSATSLIRRRPITTSIFLVSAFSLIFLSIFVNSFFRVENRKISIGLFTSQQNLGITSGRIHITKVSHTDEVFVSVVLRNNDPISEANFTLSVPEQFSLSNWYSGAGITSTGSYTSRGLTHHHFRVSSGQTAPLTIVFQAYVLSTSAPELNLRVFFDKSGNQLLPVSFMIAGLDGSDIVNVDPAPSANERSAYALQWPVLPESVISTGIWLQLRDRYAGYQREFLLVLAGIFIGVFSSLLTDIIRDAAKAVEMRLGSDK